LRSLRDGNRRASVVASIFCITAARRCYSAVTRKAAANCVVGIPRA